MATGENILHPGRVLAAAIGGLLAGGCGITAATTCDEFPASAGIQPLERDFTDVAFPDAPGGVYPHAIHVAFGPSIAHSWAHGRGYVRCSLAQVYQALHEPAASRIMTPGGHFTDSSGGEPYPISYNVEYVVYETITVRWNILTRGGLLRGTSENDPDAIVGLRYQRTCGDEHISLQSGSLQAWAAPKAAPTDPDVTQLELVGWLNATTQGPSDVGGTLTDWFANLTAVLRTLGCTP